MQLEGTTAFITGGGGGIGGGIAAALADRGVRLVLADIDGALAAEQAANIGGDTLALTLDVTSSDSWAAARRQALERFGDIDILCNNAGVSMPRVALDETPSALFASLMAVNVTGVYLGIATFVPEMRARGRGHVVNTSSINGLIAYPGLAAYSATKFAVTGLSDALRLELEPVGVGVSAVFPGLTRSRMSRSAMADTDGGAISRAALEANMMDPIWIGRAIVRAIENNDPYVISHPSSLPVLEDRFRTIVAAYGKPAQPGYGNGLSATQSI